MTRNEWIAELCVLRRVRMVVGDKATGMVGSIAEVFPKAKYHPVSWTRSTDTSADTMR